MCYFALCWVYIGVVLVCLTWWVVCSICVLFLFLFSLRVRVCCGGWWAPLWMFLYIVLQSGCYSGLVLWSCVLVGCVIGCVRIGTCGFNCAVKPDSGSCF